MAVQATAAVLPGVSSATPTTPRPHVPSLHTPIVSIFSLDGVRNNGKEGDISRGRSDTLRNGIQHDDAPGAGRVNAGGREGRVHRHEEEEDESAGADADGRITPVPGASSRSRSISGSSNHSDGDEPSPDTSISTDGQAGPSASNKGQPPPHPPQTSASTASHPTFNNLLVPPAEAGLGTMQGEDQLRSALQTKDRLFLIMVSKEVEAFLRQVGAGQAPSAALAVPPGTTSTSMLAGASFKLATAATSKFQRMLVYKAAEWYGLKAVSGGDAAIYIGVMGDLHEESLSLKLAELVPTPASPQQKFRIMQRAQGANGSGEGASKASCAAAEDGRGRTLEEREAAYALARERILGSSSTSETSSEAIRTMVEEEVRGRSRRVADDENDPVSRHPYGTQAITEPVFPSLYNLPQQDPPAPPVPPPQDPYQHGGYGYQSSSIPYTSYVAPMSGPQAMGGYPGGQMSNGYPTSQPAGHAPYGAVPQPYIDNNGNVGYIMPLQNGFAPAWTAPSISQPAMQPPQQISMRNGGWVYPNGMAQTMPPNPPMPMIPQGMQPYSPQSQYVYPPQQQPYYSNPNLVQPMPMRPQPQQHSSNSSSISSRSYQDYSRPHSRGSTTSTRSAASSVRLGAMYPAQGVGYRQQGMKGQGMNGLTSLGLGMERRSARGHSPSSATTTSSRSSGRNGSIILTQPSQHPLPSRPDWAANNIPYQPSPIPLHHHNMSAGPSTSDFPPLLRNGTYAEPMQVERAKMKPPNGTVWNGTAVKALANGQGAPYLSGGIASLSANGNGYVSPTSPRAIMVPPAPSRTPGPTMSAPMPSVQTMPITRAALAANASAAERESDPDFRRGPARSTGTLYDPSAQRSVSRAESVRNPAPVLAPIAVAPVPQTNVVSNGNGYASSNVNGSANGHGNPMTPEDVIEAKLAAVSLNVGVTIGPPRSAGAAGSAPSYAKIVRRD